MALRLLHRGGRLTLVAGFESGVASVHRLDGDGDGAPWTTTYRARAHAQPLLALDVHPSLDFFLSSAADAVIAKHPLAPAAHDAAAHSRPLKTLKTRHAGQQSLRVRSDGRLFATAGWDSRLRIYSCASLRELAVLKWHKVGAYAVAFADVGHAAAAAVAAEGIPGARDDAAAALVASDARTTRAVAGVRERRVRQARTAHWVASGAKDGKVGLWDIY